jgi:hypothetical protein
MISFGNINSILFNSALGDRLAPLLLALALLRRQAQ